MAQLLRHQAVLCVIILSALVRISNGDLTPFVAWSMDNYTESTLIPAYSADPRFRADFGRVSVEPSDAFTSGVVDNAIYLDNREFVLARDIKRDCIADPDECTYGFSILFWLKVLEWSDRNKELQTIFQTTQRSRAFPGIYFGRHEDNLLLWLQRTSGKTYSTTFPIARVTNTWTHVGITWSLTDETLLLYLDGSSQPTDTTSNVADRLTFTDLVIGSYAGPSFLLDEFNVYYQTISPEDVVTLYQTVASTLTTTASTTTTSMTTAAAVKTTTSPAATTTPVASTTTITTTIPVSTSTKGTTTRAITTKIPFSTSTTGTTTPTTEETSTSTMPTATHNTLRTWPIVVIILMSVIIFGLCLLLFFCLRRRKHHRDRVQLNQEAAELDSFHDEPDETASAKEDTDREDTDAEAANSRLLRNT